MSIVLWLYSTVLNVYNSSNLCDVFLWKLTIFRLPVFSKQYQEHWKGLLSSRTEDWERRVVFADESSNLYKWTSKTASIATKYSWPFFSTGLHFAIKLARATKNQVGLVSLLFVCSLIPKPIMYKASFLLLLWVKLRVHLIAIAQ